MEMPSVEKSRMEQEFADKMARDYVSRMQAEIGKSARELARSLGSRHGFVIDHGREVAEGAFWVLLWYATSVLLSNQSDIAGSSLFVAGVLHHACRYMEKLQAVLGGDPLAPMRGLRLTADLRRGGYEAAWLTAGAILRGSYGIAALKAEHAGLVQETMGLARDGLRNAYGLADLKRAERDLLETLDRQSAGRPMSGTA